MKDKIVTILNNISFTERYVSLCNDFSDFNNGKNFTKQEILDVINDNDFEMEFSPKEKIFFKDYIIRDFTIRFLFGYKHGFIDCLYWFFKKEETLLNESFRGIALLEDDEFNNKVSFRFPIGTSIEDLKKILSSIFKLNNDFIEELRKINE